MKKTTDGERVNWLKVKWVHVTKESPESIFLNYTFDTDRFISVSVRGRGRQVRVGDVSLESLHTSKLLLVLVSEAKKSDLVSMCRSGVILRAYHSYYEGLAVGKGMKDRLPEPDVDEEDRDTDENE